MPIYLYVMKIILSESQFKTLLEQNLEIAAGVPNINAQFMTSDELNQFLIELKQKNYDSYIDQKDIFKYIDNLPKGNFIVVEYSGNTSDNTLHQLKISAAQADRFYNKGKGAPRFYVMRERLPTGKVKDNRIKIDYGQFHGIAIVQKLKVE